VWSPSGTPCACPGTALLSGPRVALAASGTSGRAQAPDAHHERGSVQVAGAPAVFCSQRHHSPSASAVRDRKNQQYHTVTQESAEKHTVLWFDFHPGNPGENPPDTVAHIARKPQDTLPKGIHGTATYHGEAFCQVVWPIALPSVCRHEMWQHRTDSSRTGFNTEDNGAAKACGACSSSPPLQHDAHASGRLVTSGDVSCFHTSWALMVAAVGCQRPPVGHDVGSPLLHLG
jgi:hypothetical protein